jgi:hypothetical protein
VEEEEEEGAFFLISGRTKREAGESVAQQKPSFGN